MTRTASGRADRLRGVVVSATPETEFPRLIRQHRHSLSHLLIMGGTAEKRTRLAFAFHRGSPLRRGPFVHIEATRDEHPLLCALQCSLSAVMCERPDNPLRASEGGTLFIDMASRLSPATQEILLRFLESLPVPAGEVGACFGRLAVGSGVSLEEAAAADRFLPTLFDTLDKIRVDLRSRPRTPAAR